MDKRTRILLIASLVANLFLAGAVVGGLVVGSRMTSHRDDGRRGDRAGVWSAFRAIPEERRDALRRTMRAQAQAARPELTAAREARRKAAQLIAAPTYDAAAVAAALTAARESEGRARARIDEALAERLAQLTPQERADFAAVMERGPRGMRGDRGRRGPRPEGPPPPDAPPAR